MDLRSATFAVTDLETTGRSSRENRITEVAVVYLRDGEVTGEESTLINPGQYIPHQIQQMTGITNGMVATAPDGATILPDVRRWFAGDMIFAAHNVQFDHGFLQNSFARHQVPELTLPQLCTLRLARRLLPAKRGFSLGKLASYLGIRINGRHRALGDARATARILALLLEQAIDSHGCESVEDLLSLQYRPTAAFRKVPPRLQELSRSARDLPATPGIYRLVGHGGRLLYIGKAKSLRDRVSSYFTPAGGHTAKKTEMIGRVRTIEYDEVPSELSALLLESRQIKELQPKYNVAGKRIRRYAFIRLDRNLPFPYPEVVTAVPPDGAEYFGPFRNRDEASTLVDTLQKIYPLRECDGELNPAAANPPCLYYSIGRCAAPCCCAITPDEYSAVVDQVVSVLNGSEVGISSLIRSRMQTAAEALDFETAAELRDRLSEIERVFVWRQAFAESVNRNNLVVLIPEKEEVRLYLVVHGRLFTDLKIGRRFPSKKIEALLERGRKRLSAPPDLSDPIAIDEIRLVAGYLRRSAERREIVPLTDGCDLTEVLEEIRVRATAMTAARLR